MAFDTQVKEITIGLGQYLSGLGIGVWGSGFTPSQTPITFGKIPQEFASAIGLTPGIVSSDRSVGTAILRVQCYFRGVDESSLSDLRGAVKEAVDHRERLVFGGHVIPKVWWSSGASFGDTNGRDFEASDNYYMHFAQPER